MLLSSRSHSRKLTADTLFEVPDCFVAVVPFVEISRIQICGWLDEVSELSACDIVSEHSWLVITPYLHRVVSLEVASGKFLIFTPASAMLTFLSYSLEQYFTV